MIKQITIREFQRHFCKVKFDDCEVLDSNGVLIGTWKPANNGLQNTVRQDSKECPTTQVNRLEGDEKMAKFQALKAQFEGKVVRQAPDNSDLMACSTVSDTFHCDMCNKEKVECYEVEEDGLDRIICIDCVRVKIPLKMLASTLKKLKKCKRS